VLTDSVKHAEHLTIHLLAAKTIEAIWIRQFLAIGIRCVRSFATLHIQ
jgi:hypothetical protein